MLFCWVFSECQKAGCYRAQASRRGIVRRAKRWVSSRELEMKSESPPKRSLKTKLAMAAGIVAIMQRIP